MNRVQLCGLLRADPDVSIKKNGAMVAHLVLETYSSWQIELGEWRYSTSLHHITVYKESFVLFLQEKVKRGNQIFVQGLLTYNDNDETSKTKKRSIHIVVPRQNGLIFQLIDSQNLPTTQQPLSPFTWKKKISETANENKPPKSIDEIE